jgi:lipid-binding SYLF domain-containing protein
MSTPFSVAAIFLTAGLLAACSTAPPTSSERDELTQRAMTERDQWNQIDPGIEKLAKSSEGYAFFPEIVKGGLGVGGAYGRGVVFKQNKVDFGANASAIIAKTGAAANTRFVDGVAVFVRPTAGAMAEAAVGGQRMTYVAGAPR